MNRDRSDVPQVDRNASAAPDDFHWRDAWDTDEVIDDLMALGNRLMRQGDYDNCTLINMIISYIEETEDAD